jgi:hypothetical protein
MRFDGITSLLPSPEGSENRYALDEAALIGRQGFLDSGNSGIGLATVRSAGLCEVGLATTAFAAKYSRSKTNKIDGVEACLKIRGNAGHD